MHAPRGNGGLLLHLLRAVHEVTEEQAEYEMSRVVGDCIAVVRGQGAEKR